ncbi:MAG: hypothetical protein Q8S13_12570, partial [Dehalococcoidia bacterium]|nr:hypothetical protein [Dehalococcoidia bacterium]
TGNDYRINHNGTDTTITSATGNLIADNTSATGKIVERLGTNTSATAYEVRSDNDTALLSVDGAGTIRAGADMWATSPSEASGSANAIRFFDDFIDTINPAWTITEDDAGDTQVVSDGLGGVCVLTCVAATDNNAHQITWATEYFKPTSGKKIWFEARIRSASGDMTNSDWTIGLCEAEDLTGVADNMPANGIVFHKDDGAATFASSSSDAGVNLSGAGGTIVNNTWIRIGFLFDGGATGAATVTPYVNGVAGSAVASVTYVTMAELAPFFMVRNGDGVTTQTLEIDYVKVVQER